MAWIFNASYLGVTSFYGLRYVTSLGISPGPISIQCHPGSNPAAGGTLVFGLSDGTTTKTIILPDCKLDQLTGSDSSAGRQLHLRLLDRRWKWLDRYPIFGHFNQIDEHHKLIPTTVRSPFQLAVMCLTRMGEPVPAGGWESVLDLPAGLALPANPDLQIPAPASFDQLVDGTADFLKCGVNFTRSRTNPVTIWTATPAAVALAQLVEPWGRSPALNPLTNAVSIVRLGTGADLRVGRQVNFAPAISLESVPSAITALGSPTRFQLRLRFRPVGQDWDGDWKPLERLSYAPALPGPGQAMVVSGRIVDYDSAKDYILFVNGVRFACLAGSHANAVTVVTSLKVDINASGDARISGKVAATLSVTNALVLTGAITPLVGTEIHLRPDNGAYWQWRPIQGPIPSPQAQIHRQTVEITDPNFRWIAAFAQVSVSINGLVFTSHNTFAFGDPPITIPEALDDVANQINADPVANAAVQASAQGRLLALDGVVAGATVTVAAAVSDGAGVAIVATLQPAVAKAYGFHLCGMDGNLTVGSTDRLNWHEARAAAKRSVNRCYQLICEDPGDGSVKSIPVPVPLNNSKEWRIDFTDLGFNFLALDGVLTVTIDGTPVNSSVGFALAAAVSDLADQINALAGVLGSARAEGYSLYVVAPLFASLLTASVSPIEAATAFVTKTAAISVVRRNLVTLLNSRIEQVMPRPGDATALDPRTLGQPYALDTYNGYSSDRRPAVFAEIHVGCFGGIVYPVPGGMGMHTLDNQQVYIPFTVIDAERQVIQFDRPLYRYYGPGGLASLNVTLPTDPVLEIGAIIADTNTLTPYRFGVTVNIPGATAPPATRIFEDIQQELIGIYDAQHRLVDLRQNDADAEQRATLYATETAAKYQYPSSQTITYLGLELLGIDGKIRQVEWNFSRAGFDTTASENSEFSKVVPPWGDRRRAENLPPNAQRALENQLSSPAGIAKNFTKTGPAGALFGGGFS